jgi:hypothetical protein
MNDERPSAFYGSSSLGLTLLSAGRDEWPSDEALARTLTAVGAGAAVLAATGAAVAGAGVSAGTAAKGSAVLVSFGSVMKWLGVGALSGVVVAGVAHGVTPEPSPRAVVERHVPVAAQPAARAAEPAGAREPKAELAPPSADEAPKPVVSRAAPRESDDPALSNAPLAAEVALVDRARAALASGSPARALENLRDYEMAFREPRLSPEVLYLRMEAHLAAGNEAPARDVAAESVRRFPRGPHAARARQVLERNLEEKK